MKIWGLAYGRGYITYILRERQLTRLPRPYATLPINLVESSVKKFPQNAMAPAEQSEKIFQTALRVVHG